MIKSLVSLFIIISAPVATYANECIKYFAGPSSNPQSDLLKIYSEVASTVSFDMNQKSPFESIEIYNASKRRFLDRNAVHLLKLMRNGEFSYVDLVKARVFHAELVATEYSKPYSNVMIVNGKVYSFALDGSSVSILNESKIGFLVDHVKSLRLDREFIILFDGADQVRVFDAKLKDPATLDHLVRSKKVSAEFARFYSEYAKDIADVLISHSDATIQSLLQSQIMRGTVASDKSNIYLLVLGEEIVYFSKTKNFEGHPGGRSWGTLSSEAKIGFKSGANDQITLVDGKTVFDIIGSRLIPSKETILTNALLAFNHILSSAHMSHYRAGFLNTYKSEIQKLIESGELSAADVPMHRLEIAVSEMNPSVQFYILPVVSGYAYFKVGSRKESGLLKDIDSNLYGLQFSTSNYRLLEIRQRAGFTSSREVAELAPESDAQSVRAYLEKIKIALKLKDVSEAQSKRLSEIARLLEQLNMDLNGLAMGGDANQLMEVVKTVINVMIKDNVFTKEQAEQFIKMSIAFPIQFQ